MRTLVLTAGAVVALAAGLPSTAHAQGGACGEWANVPAPAVPVGWLGDSELLDVAVLAPDDIWAVGEAYMGSPNWNTETLAMHWNGTAWTIVPTPSPSTTINSLETVAAVAPDDVWAAGVKEIFTPFRELRQLVLHWDGSSWQEIDVGNASVWGGNVYDIEVIAADDIWFGGEGGGALAMHYDGSSFVNLPTPTFNTGNCSGTYGCGHAIESLAAVAPDDIWAVGGAGDGDYSLVSQIFHWDGQSWSHVPGPTVGYEQRLFGVVALAANDVWAFGDYLPIDPNNPGLLAYHWSGSGWTQVSIPLAFPYGGFLDAVALSPTDIWAVGTYNDPALSAGLPLAMHYDGSSWQQVFADPVASGSFLAIEPAGSCDIWAAGRSSAVPLSQRLTPQVPSLRLASFDGSDECAAGVGDGNGVWEPGERVTIPVTLGAFSGGFTGITGTLTTSTPGVTIVDGTATWPSMPVGSNAVSDAPHFLVEIGPGVPCGSTLDFSLSVTAAEGGPYAVAFQQEIGAPATAPGLPVAVPDGQPAGVTSTMTITDDVVLTDVDVYVEVLHPFVGDVKIELESPAGTRVTLLDRPGVPASTLGCGYDDMFVTFDDSSTKDLESHCTGTDPWYSGVAAPAEPLSVLDGESSAGTWKLIVSDHATTYTGSLEAWELITTPRVFASCNVCSGGSGVTGAVSIAGAESFGLALPRPNPFREVTDLAFTLERAGRVRLDVFDVAGRRVATPADREMPAGRHVVSWEGRDSGGMAVASGIYFVRLTQGDRSDLRRVIRVR